MAAAKHTTPAQLDFSFTEPEEWRDISGYEGLYQVSSLGRVRSLTRKARSTTNLAGWRAVGGRIRKLSRHRPSERYLGICLSKEGHHKNIMVHTLVLQTFVGPAPEGYTCNHLDGDPTNNRLENLAWVTQKENIHHSMRLGLKPSGEQSPHAKLTACHVREIRRLAAEGRTFRALAHVYGVGPTAIRMVVIRRTWKHVP